ncbi:hypothetical protein SADUNF_Sadunf06G0040200 [Salix dunnii]|uniref:Uncharacterized protein n=1 Tax=Salix dunnii TaxID=1413687 RepID=A0A835MW98_9ROSI|nr:hypothetical protein SADUNF_Sadunf06G0040200 [Salix dunnii]
MPSESAGNYFLLETSIRFDNCRAGMVVVASLHNCGVMGQTIAPTPAMDAGAGLELPISMAVISSSMILSLLALMLQ